MDKHEAYTIPQGCTPVLRISKPDKTYCIQEGTVQSNRLIFAPKPQAFTAAGTAKAEVSLFAEDGRRVTSATFDIIIPPECVCDCGTESGSYVDVMSEQIRAAIEAAERAEEAAKRAEEATDADNIAQAVSEYLTENPPAPGPAGPAGPTGEKGEKGEKGEPGAIKFIIVKELPAAGDGDAIYLLPATTGGGNNNFEEYIFTENGWECIGSAGVEVNLDDYVKNTDYATADKAGVVKVGTGLSVGTDNKLQIQYADKNAIKNKLAYRDPLVPRFIDDIVKTGITTNQIPLTDEEKQAAKDWLGVVDGGGAEPIWEEVAKHTIEAETTTWSYSFEATDEILVIATGLLCNKDLISIEMCVNTGVLSQGGNCVTTGNMLHTAAGTTLRAHIKAIDDGLFKCEHGEYGGASACVWKGGVGYHNTPNSTTRKITRFSIAANSYATNKLKAGTITIKRRVN